MSVSIQVASTAPARFDERSIALAQSAPVSIEPSASPEAGFDGHFKVSDFLALYLMLLEEVQKHRAANQLMSSQAGLLEQSVSYGQAQHVRDEGGHLLAGAVAGAVLGFGLGAVGAVMSHRAFGKQAGGAAPFERPRSGSITHSVEDDMSRPASPASDMMDLDRLLINRPDTGPASQFSSRSGSVRSNSVDDDMSQPASPASDLLDLDRLLINRPDTGPASQFSSRSGSVRSTSSQAGSIDHSDASRTPDAPATPNPMHYARGGLMGQMLVSNAASLAAVGAAGGQMSAALDRADAGMLQTAGMISQSTKRNRGEDASNSNGDVSRVLAALSEQNRDLRQTFSQITSSIRA